MESCAYTADAVTLLLMSQYKWVVNNVAVTYKLLSMMMWQVCDPFVNF